METKAAHKDNHEAFRSLKQEIDEKYPQGRFVAIDQCRVVADAATFDELNDRLNNMGMNSPDILVIQAGDEYPETTYILFSASVLGV